MATAWIEIGDRLFVRRYSFADQTIGAVVGDDQVLLIDTRSSHRQAAEIARDLREITPFPVRVVVNTHWHSDHCFGNRALRPATIWGHERCASGLVETGPRQLAALAETLPDMAEELAEVVIDPPERTFQETAYVDFGGRRIELRFLGRAHTDSDIVVLVPDAGVLFAGDLLENGAPPYFDDGYPLDWPETVSRLLELMRGPVVVPGHGEVADRAFAEDQLASFIAIAELGRRVHRGGLGLQEALDRGPYGSAGSRAPIERALAQLRGELD
jgi:glyoxylase-like metal-dependent hydrolase (beta-lactamase superfamily II)